MNGHFGIRALAVCMPDQVRANSFWRTELVQQHETRTLARIFATTDKAAPSAEPVDAEMTKYLSDPFRGTVERRVLARDETALDLEATAVERALSAAYMPRKDIDLAIVTSFPAQEPGASAHLVRRLGLRCAAWNLESACSSSLVATEAATAFLASGRYRNVLIVTSCSYSRVSDEGDSLAWFLGDGAGALIVGHEQEGIGILGCETRHTASTCDTFYMRPEMDTQGAPVLRLRSRPETQRILRETAPGFIRDCCESAARNAGVELDDIDFFVFNTPTAWFADVCVRTLGITTAKTVNTYPYYANVGPALFPVNLHHAATEGLIRRGNLVLAFTIGSVSTAAATVMRWGDVALGPPVVRARAVGD